jgi:hypothetical protein
MPERRPWPHHSPLVCWLMLTACALASNPAMGTDSAQWSNKAIAEWTMQRVYGPCNTQFDCSPKNFADGTYCLRVQRVDRVLTTDDYRWYVFASGDCSTLSEKLQCVAGVSSQGLIGAFVIAS